MASVFLEFGQQNAQMGAGQAVVQRPEFSASDMRAAFTSSLLIGVAFFGLLVAVAPPVRALFPHNPSVGDSKSPARCRSPSCSAALRSRRAACCAAASPSA